MNPGHTTAPEHVQTDLQKRGIAPFMFTKWNQCPKRRTWYNISKHNHISTNENIGSQAETKNKKYRYQHNKQTLKKVAEVTDEVTDN